MTLQEINNAYDRIVGSLDSKELKNAFDSLHSLIAGSREYLFEDKLNELQDTYKYMLSYRIEGVKDPMQEQIYKKLQASTYELADAVRQKALAVESPLTYYSRRRRLSIQQPSTFQNLHDQLAIMFESGNRKEIEAFNILIFNRIWTSSFLSQEEVKDIRDLLEDKELPFTTGCLIVSALMLGLQEAFDREKLLLLFDAANLQEEEISVRALISILITLYTYRKRTALYPQIANRLAALAEVPGFTKIILKIILRFILARETEKITRKIQDEIIPEMMKLSPKLSNKFNLKDITPEQLGDEMNPEWESLLSDSNLGKKIMEFGELQMEGADIMHSTFVHLKNFPFFSELTHWMLPFTPAHSSLDSLLTPENAAEKLMLDNINQASFICNSDKYSLYFSMKNLPEEARRMMTEQFNSQAAEFIRLNSEEIIDPQRHRDTIIRQYIQDLYRFFKLYPDRQEFKDIFTMPLDFHNLDILHPYLSDKESLTAISEYYLRKNYFSDALTIFDKLAIEEDHDSEILFQKIGYCKQMEGDLKGALEAYLHADLLNSESKWVIRRIAACYRSLKQPEKALEFYRRYEALNPDNLSVQISIGHCLLELKDYDAALKCFFKVDYLDNQSHKAWRPIAWCSFLTGKYDQARNYYKKIMENDPNAQDLLNSGHTEWALQNIRGALSRYRQAMQKENGNFAKFQDLFIQDIPDLQAAGIDETEIALMLDQLRYMEDGEMNLTE